MLAVAKNLTATSPRAVYLREEGSWREEEKYFAMKNCPLWGGTPERPYTYSDPLLVK